jgi:hypothetical protein
MASRVDEKVLSWGKNPLKLPLFRAYLRFEISMNVPELMQLAHSREHFADVESCVFLLEDARIVE